MNHSMVKPTLAASAGVAISSPEPTMVAVMISPGPRCLRMPLKSVGAGLGSMGELKIKGLVELDWFQYDFAKGHRAVVALQHDRAVRFFVLKE